MFLRRAIVTWYRSVEFLEFDAAPFAVLFGKNNAGKTVLVEAVIRDLDSSELPVLSVTNSKRHE